MSEVKSPETKRTELLHDIAVRTAKSSINEDLELAMDILSYYEDIEDKTADDLRRMKEQSKLVDTLGGAEYKNLLQNLFVEHFNSLSDEHLARYHENIIYEEALIGVQLQLAPALEEAKQVLVHGVFEKPSLH